MHSQINFGYPWLISYVHLFVAIPFVALVAIGLWRKWPKLVLGLLSLAAAWALTAWVIVRFQFDLNGRATLPTEAFLRSGSGRVLDMGAGTGRSTLMVLEARPHTTVVALDLFGESYEQHFGNAPAGESAIDQGPAALMRNLHAAGVDRRASVQPGDMRHMPLDSGSFDAIVSSYAIDHLDNEDMDRALREANRVLKPGGEFLLMVIAREPWLMFTFGPLLAHAHMTAAGFWAQKLSDASFEILEEGTHPATRYLLARRTASAP